MVRGEDLLLQTCKEEKKVQNLIRMLKHKNESDAEEQKQDTAADG